MINKEIYLNERLSIGKTITEEEQNRIKAESNNKTAFLKAIDYISRKKCCKKMLSDYLKKKDFDNKAIDYAIQKLSDYRYIDDEDYARCYIEYYGNGKGRQKLAYELKNKGIDPDIIEKYNKDDQKELKDCIILSEKFMKNKDISDIKTKQKLIRHLLYKGFNYNIIQNALAKFNINEEELWNTLY